MKLPMWQVDAFAAQRFRGNPAAVVPSDTWLPGATMQAIAAENNLAETAFFVAKGDEWELRWFTPTVEVPLCGHATLASAAVVLERLETRRADVVFRSASGPLRVERTASGYMMDFPARPSERTPTPPAVAAALGIEPAEVHVNAFNYLAVLESPETVRALEPDLAAVAALDRPGVIVTAPGERPYDMVSRYFAPAKGVPEDPVTGGAHCMLAPYWAARLGRQELRAFQASRRGGELTCRVRGDRVELEGACVFYLEGTIEV